MISLEFEKESKLTASNICDILHFAIDIADDNGFVNSYIYERAIYLFAAIVLYPEKKEDIAAAIAESPMEAWDKYFKDGTMEKLQTEFPKECEALATVGQTWFEEFTRYATSARGLLNIIQTLTGDIVNQAAQKFNKEMKDSSIQEIFKIAEDWQQK